jgi:phytoene dehydrogenase-like protein
MVPASAALRAWASAAVPVEAAILDVALDRLPPRARRFALGIDTPLYLSTHSEWAAGLAADGGALVTVAKYLRPGRPADPEADRQELEAFLDLAQPGWRTHRLHSRFLPSITVTNDVAVASAGGLGGRPGPAVPGVPGLYVAGDWVGSRGLLAQASLESAIAAVDAAAAGASHRVSVLTG